MPAHAHAASRAARRPRPGASLMSAALRTSSCSLRSARGVRVGREPEPRLAHRALVVAHAGVRALEQRVDVGAVGLPSSRPPSARRSPSRSRPCRSWPARRPPPRRSADPAAGGGGGASRRCRAPSAGTAAPRRADDATAMHDDQERAAPSAAAAMASASRRQPRRRRLERVAERRAHERRESACCGAGSRAGRAVGAERERRARRATRPALDRVLASDASGERLGDAPAGRELHAPPCRAPR